MINQLKRYARQFDAKPQRERMLIALTLLVAMGFAWWTYYTEPLIQQSDKLRQQNQQLLDENLRTRTTLAELQQRITGGVHQAKASQLERLREQLAGFEQRLRQETVQLIDPEKMFQLMNELVYRESNLKLLGLKRREVKPAIPTDEDEESQQVTIYRHLLELEYAGSYVDILRYVRTLEALDWKLLWDEIEIDSEEYPNTTVKLVISTLSTRREWVGI